MTILGSKDSDRMEVVRKISDSDPVFFPILNRPHDDIEQRTKDLDSIFTPARGLRVRQTSTASANIEVEIGMYIAADGVTVTKSNGGAVQTIAIPASGAGQRRIDLIYFNLATGVASRVASAEFPAATSFSFTLRPNLPSGVDSIPLALLFVDETPTPFDETISTDVAGRVIDVRPAIGADRPLFSTVAPVTDVTSGSTGSAVSISRSDHRHALNVDATLPTTLDVSAASAGSAGIYSRRDHKHTLSAETVASNLKKDGTASVGVSAKILRADHAHPLNNSAATPNQDGVGAAGSATAYARSDHRHPLNTPSSGLPESLDSTLSAARGTDSGYSRFDHVHDTSNLALQSALYTLQWTNDSTAKTTGAIGFVPVAAIVIFAGFNNDTNRPVSSTGLIRGTSGSARSISSSNDGSGSSSLWTSGPDNDSGFGGSTVGSGYAVSHNEWEADVTVFGAGGITLDPTVTITGIAYLLVLGQEK